MESNGFGLLSEMEFTVKALKMGLNISRPMIQSKYDFISDFNGKILRVQVKSSSVIRTSHKETSCQITVSHGSSNKKNYTDNDIDFFVIHLIPVDAWYIIPVNHLLNKKKIIIFPNSSKSKYLQFKENWELLK